MAVSSHDTLLLNSFNLEVKPGDFYHLVGSNGIGKSTLLKTLAGLKKASKGTLDCKCPLNYIGHELALMDACTVSENIDFYAGLYGTHHQIKSIQASYALLPIWDHFIFDCSRGQKQRIALCRLKLYPTQLWILDEVFTSLDTHYQAYLQKDMQAHLTAGGAIILAAHKKYLHCSHQVITL